MDEVEYYNLAASIGSSSHRAINAAIEASEEKMVDMMIQHLYRDHEISMMEIATRLNVPRKRVSKVVKT